MSQSALNLICETLHVPPAVAYGVASFYALFALEERPQRVVHRPGVPGQRRRDGVRRPHRARRRGGEGARRGHVAAQPVPRRLRTGPRGADVPGGRPGHHRAGRPGDRRVRGAGRPAATRG
nr:NAD(P)H-dependent oxidoreductase subunit E [Amycolatopsis australiensis]